MGYFNEDETHELITGWTDHYGLNPGEWQTDVLELAKEANNYHVHVHNLLASFADELVRVDGKTAKVRMDQVRSSASHLRQVFYRARMSPEMIALVLLFGSVVSDLRPGMRRGMILNLIKQHSRPFENDVRWQIPDDMRLAEYYDPLVHRGALHEEANLTVACPIPSFRDWIIENAGVNLSIEVIPGSREVHWEPEVERQPGP